MGALSISFLLYLAFAAVIGALVHSKGRVLSKIYPFELLFLFMPWLTLLAMGVIFFGSIDYFEKSSGIWMYFWGLQSISAGIIGGFILMPRYFVLAETTASRVLVNTMSALAFSGLFAFSRIFLFALSNPEINQARALAG